jgi:hypothetical protein
MRSIRIFLRRYPALALAVLALALAVKAMVPAGYMLAADSKSLSLTVTVCTGMDTMQKTIEIPVHKSQDGKSSHEQAGDSPCAFTALSHALLGGADGILLALALLFIVTVGFGSITPNLVQKWRRLRPPLRGPPVFS